MYKNQFVFWIVIFSMFFADSIRPKGHQGCEKPNIILITIDTTRADHLSCYGYPINTTPVIDQLAETGVRCSFGIAQSSITTTSCASQLSGTYPYRHGIRTLFCSGKNGMMKNVPTIPGELRKIGYKTAGFVSAYPASSQYGFSEGFDLFDDEFLKHKKSTQLDTPDKLQKGKPQRTAAETNRKVLPWIRKNAGETFFAWIHYFDPHDRHFIPPDAILDKFLRASPEEDKQEYARSIYDAEIYFTDLHIGEIVNQLKSLGIRNRTVLIITADHGQSLGDPDIWGHGFLYQEQIRVPLVLNGPGIPEGRVISSIVEHVDIFPTILDLVKPGLSEKVEGIQGTSLRSFFQEERPLEKKQAAYSEVPNPRKVIHVPGALDTNKIGVSEDDHSHFMEDSIKKPNQDRIYCLIKDEWKFFHFPDDPRLDRLYNLKTDPEEQDNVIGVNRDMASELLKELERREAINLQIPEDLGLSKDDIEHLNALGYFDSNEVPLHEASKKNNREDQDDSQINKE